MSRKLFEKREREWDVTVVRYTIHSQPFIIKCSSAAFSSLYGFCFHFKVEFPSKIKLQMKGKSNYVDIADFSSILFSPSLAFPFPILISLTVRSSRSCFLMKAAFCSWAVPIIITITSPLDTGKRIVIKKISECLTGYNLLFFSFSIIDLFGLQPLNQQYSWHCSNNILTMLKRCGVGVSRLFSSFLQSEQHDIMLQTKQNVSFQVAVLMSVLHWSVHSDVQRWNDHLTLQTYICC